MGSVVWVRGERLVKGSTCQVQRSLCAEGKQPPHPSCSVDSGLKSGGCERVEESGVCLGDRAGMGKGTDTE